MGLEIATHLRHVFGRDDNLGIFRAVVGIVAVVGLSEFGVGVAAGGGCSSLELGIAVWVVDGRLREDGRDVVEGLNEGQFGLVLEDVLFRHLHLARCFH